jgi:hypothetical protein
MHFSKLIADIWRSKLCSTRQMFVRIMDENRRGLMILMTMSSGLMKTIAFGGKRCFVYKYTADPDNIMHRRSVNLIANTEKHTCISGANFFSPNESLDVAPSELCANKFNMKVQPSVNKTFD